MKTIGLLGGMSWESTAVYYRLLNQGVKAQLGDHHSASIAMVSLDFEPIKALQFAGRWDEAAQILVNAARRIEAAGADFLLICTNTMHKLANVVQESIDIPLLHLADATAKRINEQGLTRIGLLGTQFTMTEDFYKRRLTQEHGIEVLIPAPSDCEIIHRIIYEELCHGIVRDESRDEYLRIIEILRSLGAEGVIEGCTEIAMLIQQFHTPVPLFDTTTIHAEQAVRMALTG